MIAVMFIVVSIQLFTTGLLGEIVSRTYFSTSGQKSYLIRKRSSSSFEHSSWKNADSETLQSADKVE